ncbi:DUF2627 family protein [Pontibacillus litoralis]|uniref:DUF2627 domain-containing protein n=1 Tax=Pontibacillus litoralis JSM 072002 TaxID=1385512 RepID=A0A0A5G9U4_9BACI|nr:DUF2627 family protein [Pontibacillus litoralis]KGX88824.1 hypothetical protein N784_00285 [Pontibacillus litoralis JSM 072002]
MSRLIAVIILFIPGALSVLGIKMMRDTLFMIEYPFFIGLWLQFLVGLLFFLLGLFFIGGFILYRDKKRGKTQERFK